MRSFRDHRSPLGPVARSGFGASTPSPRLRTSGRPCRSTFDLLPKARCRTLETSPLKVSLCRARSCRRSGSRSESLASASESPPDVPGYPPAEAPARAGLIPINRVTAAVARVEQPKPTRVLSPVRRARRHPGAVIAVSRSLNSPQETLARSRRGFRPRFLHPRPGSSGDRATAS